MFARVGSTSDGGGGHAVAKHAALLATGFGTKSKSVLNHTGIVGYPLALVCDDDRRKKTKMQHIKAWNSNCCTGHPGKKRKWMR